MVGESQRTKNRQRARPHGRLPRHPSQPTGKGALPAAMDAWLPLCLGRERYSDPDSLESIQHLLVLYKGHTGRSQNTPRAALLASFPFQRRKKGWLPSQGYRAKA